MHRPHPPRISLKRRLATPGLRLVALVWERVVEELALSHEIAAGGSPQYHSKCARLCERLLEKTGNRVFAGPFAGMRVPALGAFATTPALLVGSYEAELHPAIQSGLVQGFTQVVNIGSGEGYYAVGLAWMMPHTNVVAFDTQDTCHNVCRAAAHLNEVATRIDQRGRCTVEELASLIQPKSLVICDCEGAEGDLLDPQEAPALISSTVICELHDFYDPSITPSLISRFRRTHSLDILHQRGRSARDFPILDTFSEREKWLALHENRHVDGVQFLGRYMVMTPKSC